MLGKLEVEQKATGSDAPEAFRRARPGQGVGLEAQHVVE
jgi:hypothetical protein